jgi:ATP-dependent RNA helicase DeaD
LTKTFQELGIDVDTTKALKESGYEDPFPIQQEAIPLMLKGIDVIGQAHTGTGKTAAFALPILTKIKRRGPIQALILVPTRELAVQVTVEINKFAKYTGIRTVSIYGGQSIGIQHDQLRKGVQILVATPGRLIDHIKQGSIDLENVKFVVLDEADRMLDMGFIDDIKFILRLAQEYMKDYEEVRLNEEELSLDTIDQSYLMVYEKEKFKHLCDFIRMREKKQTIVFAATKQRAHRLASELKQEGFRAITIHGDLSQSQRDSAMYKFRKGLEDILVATDIAARGIDVPAVGHVINYDIPEDPLIYFHRIGRTARAGATGKAVSLVSQDRIDDFGRILRQTKHPIRKLNDEMGIEIPITQQRQQYPRSFSGRYQRCNYQYHNRDRRGGTKYRRYEGNNYRQTRRSGGYSYRQHSGYNSYRNNRLY